MKRSVCWISCCAALAALAAACPPPSALAQQSAVVKRAEVKTQANEKDGAAMVWVPATTFTMGNGPDAHKVTLTHGYWLYRTPVTNAQFRKFVQATKYSSEPQFWTRPAFKGEDLPVVGVSHADAAAYAKWAGGRLPTEAEWEWAARGPEGSRYPWGNAELTERLAVFRPDEGEGPAGPAAVGSKPNGTSWCGALDMAGNVYQWCADWYVPQKAETAVDPLVAEKVDANQRVIRGGSWAHSELPLRSTYRNFLPPDATTDSLGFRVVVEARR